MRCKPLPRRIEKTEAESVDDIVEANRSEAVRLSGIVPRAGILKMVWMRTPVRTAVRTTPRVARTTPGPRTGLISDTLVSRPPEKRMIQRATVPMACATERLENWIPKPSEPQTIPTPRKRRSNGTPNLYPALQARILRKKRIETPKRTASTDIIL